MQDDSVRVLIVCLLLCCRHETCSNTWGRKRRRSFRYTVLLYRWTCLATHSYYCRPDPSYNRLFSWLTDNSTLTCVHIDMLPHKGHSSMHLRYNIYLFWCKPQLTLWCGERKPNPQQGTACLSLSPVPKPSRGAFLAPSAPNTRRLPCVAWLVSANSLYLYVHIILMFYMFSY